MPQYIEIYRQRLIQIQKKKNSGFYVIKLRFEEKRIRQLIKLLKKGDESFKEVKTLIKPSKV